MRNNDANMRGRPGIRVIERSLHSATQGDVKRITLRKNMSSRKGKNKNQQKRQQYFRIHLQFSYSLLNQPSFLFIYDECARAPRIFLIVFMSTPSFSSANL